MAADYIRPIALCVFQNAGRILVIPRHDSRKKQDFYRPVGGGIEFGESSREALVREVREELSEEIAAVKLLGTFENIFIHEGAPGHEIVFAYDAVFTNRSLYAARELQGNEDGQPFRVIWRPVSDFASGRDILYPTGLLAVLNHPAR